MDWQQPFCGAAFTGLVAGDPVTCDLPVHAPQTQHRNLELGWSWW